MPIQYLTGAHNDAVAAVAHERNVGLLVQPGNRYDLQVHRYPTWAGDNGAFTKAKGGFSPEKFRTMIQRPALLVARATCLFVVAPDKLVVLPDGAVVGDARGTLEQFPAWAEEIRDLGYPVAFVAQNGLEHMLFEVPWDLVDVLFIGGSTEWKIGPGAKACADAAIRRGKRVHMGRVNSGKRMLIAQSFGCDTADGTFLAFGPEKNLPRRTYHRRCCRFVISTPVRAPANVRNVTPKSIKSKEPEMGMILSYLVQQHANAAALHNQDAEMLEFYFGDPESVRRAAHNRELAVEADARAELAKAYLKRCTAEMSHSQWLETRGYAGMCLRCGGGLRCGESHTFSCS